ncbi:MAG: PepSY domain-containing protein [Pseudomonadota bacterium]|nr:PepSY domain-containing protein [Pseudomonadota bacterium]
MLSIRTVHTYLGILIAPSVLFFALTGALQLFSLHEAHGSYVPPAFIEKLSSVHKDQVFAQKAHEENGPAPADAKEHTPPAAEHEAEPQLGTVLLKWCFLLVALALCTSTALGLWIGLTHVRRTRTRWMLLGIGILLPTALLILGS